MIQLRQLRTRKKYTQEDLAQRLAVSRSTISMWESGIRMPDYQMLVKLCSVFHITLSELLGMRPEDGSTHKIPVFSMIAAEYATRELSWDGEFSYEEMDGAVAQNGIHIGMRVKNGDMEPNIQNGDVVIVRKQETIENNMIGLVTIGKGCAIIRKIKTESNGILLIPFNPDAEVAFFSREEILQLPVCIIGQVVELRRKFH